MNKDLLPSPVTVLSGYIKSRYDINESFENLINALKAKEIEYTKLFEKQIVDAYNEVKSCNKLMQKQRDNQSNKHA